MAIVELKMYRAKEISFFNKVENGTKIEFENKYSYNVSYGQNNMCKGELSISACAKEAPDKFGVKVIMEGVFRFDEGEKREKIHVASFKELFPYAKALISTVSANAGVPAIMVPAIDIEKQSIYKYDYKNPFGKPDENNTDAE